MSRKLTIITRRYPYSSTEVFLETEIPIISKFFDRVEIFPLKMSTKRRSIPSNVFVYNSIAIYNKSKVFRILLTFFSFSFWKGLYHHFSLIRSMKSIKTIFIFFSRELLIRKGIKNQRDRFSNTLLYTYWFNEATYSLLRLMDMGIIEKTKIVSRAHRYDLYEDNSNDIYSFWPYRSFCMQKIDRIYSISENGKQFLTKKYGFAEKILVSRLGVKKNEDIRLLANMDMLNVVSVAWVSDRKRVDLILSSLKHFAIHNSSQNIIWTHFGDGPLFKELQRLIEEEKMPPNLIIKLMGNASNESVYSFYKHSFINVFINLSSSEGVPVSIMEAQSFGIPVIATNVGATNEIVTEETGILLAENPSIKEVCEAIRKVIERNYDPVLIKERCLSNYDSSHNYHSFASSLREMLE